MKAKALVARNIKKFRVRKGLSQENLAFDAGIDRTYVSQLERGLKNPTVVILERLAKVLDVKIEDFFVAPSLGEKAPKSLPGGRKKR